MSKTNITREQLYRYFTGDETLSREEEEMIGKEISEDPTWLQLIYGSADPENRVIDWQTDEQLRRLEERLGIGHSTLRRARSREPIAGTETSRRNHVHRLHARAVFFRIAAVALIAVATATAFWMWESARALPEVREIIAEKGQRLRVPLEDGTVVLLNADSKLIISAPFDGDTREVSLEGEAYFEVAEDTERPFLVHSGNATVQVLATAFGVRSYSEDEQVQVVVTRGRVSLRSTTDNVKEGVHLGMRDAGHLAATGVISVRRNVDTDSYLSWIKGRLVFRDMPFGEVASQLERWYNLTIAIEDERLKSLPLTASFEDQSPAQVLDVLAATLGITYLVDGRTVRIYADNS